MNHKRGRAKNQRWHQHFKPQKANGYSTAKNTPFRDARRMVEPGVESGYLLPPVDLSFLAETPWQGIKWATKQAEAVA